MKRTITVGKTLAFDYPACNRLGLPLEFIRRAIVVEETIDLLYEPLSLEEFLQDPLHRYGRSLVTGIDADSGEQASFYHEAMYRRRPLPALRLGLFDPSSSGEGPLSFIPRLFPATVEARRHLAAVILDFQEKFPGKWCGNPYQLALFPEVSP